MVFSITVNTRFAGSPKGTFLEDLTDLVVGQSTGAPNSKKISKIAVYAGGIIDSVRITYKAENVPTPLTVQHGGPGGVEALSFNIAADEKLVAVYGTRLVSPSPWNERHISQLSFIVVKSSGDVPTTKVYTATGNYIAPTEKFELSFPLTTASSYTFQPRKGSTLSDGTSADAFTEGIQDSYLEGIGFSNVSFKADQAP